MVVVGTVAWGSDLIRGRCVTLNTLNDIGEEVTERSEGLSPTSIRKKIPAPAGANISLFTGSRNYFASPRPLEHSPRHGVSRVASNSRSRKGDYFDTHLMRVSKLLTNGIRWIERFFCFLNSLA